MFTPCECEHMTDRQKLVVFEQYLKICSRSQFIFSFFPGAGYRLRNKRGKTGCNQFTEIKKTELVGCSYLGYFPILVTLGNIVQPVRFENNNPSTLMTTPNRLPETTCSRCIACRVWIRMKIPATKALHFCT